MRFAVGAAGLGIKDSGLELNKLDRAESAWSWTGLVPVDLPELTPALMDSCDENGKLDSTRLGEQGASALFPLWILKYLPNMVAAHISLAFNAQARQYDHHGNARPARRRSARASA